MIIGLTGTAGSGKGTVADILVDELDFTKMSFADSVKDVCAAVFGWDRALLEGDTPESRIWREKQDEWWTKKLNWSGGFTPRIALQQIGTDVFHQFDKHIWIYSLQVRLAKFPNSDIVIPDVRFATEISFVENSGGYVVGVDGGEKTTTSSSDHVTEKLAYTYQPKIKIRNYGTIQELSHNVAHVFSILSEIERSKAHTKELMEDIAIVGKLPDHENK